MPSLARAVIMAAALLVLVLGVVRCVLSPPSAEVVVPWPNQAVSVRIQVWGSSAPGFWVAVENAKGRLSHVLWEDWGPARQGNLYVTPAGSLAIIGGGGLATIVEIVPHAPPREMHAAQISDAQEWRYLGRFVLGRYGDLRFHSASEHRECIPLYGAGFVPVRKEHQVAGDC